MDPLILPSSRHHSVTVGRKRQVPASQCWDSDDALWKPMAILGYSQLETPLITECDWFFLPNNMG
jgi:hypothetical protein